MKNRHFLVVAFLLVFSVSVIAQNKIGDNPAVIQTGSLLELESLSKGLRLPRIPLNDVTKWTLDGSPTSGMVIFNDSGTVPHGLYYWNMDSSQWDQVVSLSKLILELAKKEDITNKSTDVNIDAASDTKYPSVKAIKTYVDVAVTGATIADADAATKGKIQLAGDLAGTAAAPTVPGLLLKEDVTNKSANIIADAASNAKYPGVKAIKDYVDVAVAGATIADADAATKGKIQLAGDLGGTAALPTVPALSNKVDKTITVNGQALSANVTLGKADVGLSNVDNTSDVNKPISTATQTALDLKADKSITVNGQALSANVTIGKADVGLSNVDNTSDVNKPISTVTQTALDSKADKSITVNGQALSANVTLGKTDVGLSNVDNTSDVNKPVSTATQTALDLKADKSITVNGQALSANVTLTKTDVGLSDADNTSDINKPISTATQTALNLKEDLINKSTSIVADGGSDTKYPSTKAVKTYVDAATPDATTLATGKIQLAGDLSGTATAPTIANGAVTNTKLASDAVTSTNILDGTIAAADLGANAVTTAKIANGAVTAAKIEPLSDANILVGTATGNAKVPVTGDVTMANTGITSIATNAITTTKIADAAVTTSKLETLPDANILVGTATGNAKVPVTGDVTMANTGVTTIAANAVTTSKISAAAVTGDKIAQMTATDKQVLSWDNASSVWKPTTVSDSKVQVAGTVDAKELNATDFDNSGADIAIKTNAVTTTKIADAAVTSRKIEGLANGQIIVGVDGTAANNAKVALSGDVTMANTGVTTIATNAVTTTKIADAAVTLPKMANLAGVSLIGNNTGLAAAPKAITLGAGLSFSGTTLTAINQNFISINASTYTVTSTDYIVKCMSGSTLVTLPNPATSLGRSLIFIEGTGMGVITFDSTIFGGVQAVAAGFTYLAICDGTNWRLCGQ